MRAAGPLNLPSVRDEGPVSVRRDLDNPAIQGFMRAASVRNEGAQALARGIGAFAAGLEKLGEDRDRAKALEAYNNYVSRSSQLLYNADNGFMNAQGAGAEGLAARVGEAHDGLRDEVTAGLSGRQRQLFLESAASYDRDVARSAMRYEGRAMAEYRKSEGLKSLDNMAAAWAANPDEISMETQEESVYSVALAVYGDQGDMANADNIRGVRSQLVARAALLMAERDPIRAESFVKENGELMEPSARESVSQKVQEAALTAHIQEDTPALFEEYGFDGLAEAREFIRDNYSGTEENKRISAAESYWREMVQNRNANEAKAYDDIIGLMEDGASLQAVNNAIEAFDWSSNRMRRSIESERDEFFRIGRFAPSGGGFRIDWDAVIEVDELKHNGKILEVCPTMNDFIKKYGSRVGRDVLTEFRKYYNRLRSGESDVTVKMDINYTAVFMDKLKKAGITDRSEQEHWKGVYQSFYDEIKNNPKRTEPITSEMAVNLMDQILAPAVVGSSRRWWGGSRDVTVRRGEIPRGAEQGSDGRWYVEDEDGIYRPIIFPGTDEYREAERAGVGGMYDGAEWDIPEM